MSFQAYVDEKLVGSGNITQGAILGTDGGTWANSAGFQLKEGEGSTLAGLFADSATAISSGFDIDGVHYVPFKADNRSIYGKNEPAQGVACVKTKQCIVIGVYDEGYEPAAIGTVEMVGDFLTENGY